MFRPLALAFLLLAFTPTLIHAQSSFETDVHVANSRWSEFEGHDVGVGARVTWKPSTLVGVDADLTWYPSNFPGDTFAFSGYRLEGLFGVTAGPRINRVRPFVKAGAGFLKSSEAPEPFACIAIFPPPLNCLMASGRMRPVIEIGGGVEVSATDRTFVRVDVADRMIQYPAPTFNSDFEVIDEAFYGHALRFTVGLGFRFQ